ncbi:MAG: DNA-directed RNA polymerase subunit A'' [Nanoarchaeota archaeon]
MKDNAIDFAAALPKKILDEFEELAAAEKLTQKQKQEALALLHEEYQNSKISPGEAIGIITAESFGEPGTQMSLFFSNKIIVKINNNKIFTVKIGPFVDMLMKMKGSFKLNDHSEILPLHDFEIYVPSLNQEEKIEWKRVIECSRHITNKKLMRITTASGRSVTCTDNHSFVNRIHNKITPIKGTELQIGNRIPVINSFVNPLPMQELSIKNHIIDNEGIVEEKGVLSKPGTNAKSMNGSLPLNESTGWFIGAYLAEGNGGKYHASLYNVNDNYINNGKRFADSLGIEPVDRFYIGEYGPGRSLTLHSGFLGSFIITHCGQGSDFKKVPYFAYSASDAFISGLLRGYFDGDGNFHVDRKMIRCSSNSKELIDGIALLLSRFRIFSFKVQDKKGQHWLLIPYKYAPLFLQHIGSDIDYKRASLETLAEKAKRFWNSRSQDYTDMISGFGELFRNTAKKVGYPTRYVNNFTNRQKIGRTALFRYMKLFEHLAKEKNIDIKDELAIMQRMSSSDVVWDEIVKIEYVDNDKPVYDLSVPGLETFTTADGIITHNTLNVFHFAGVAEVAVTQGLPRLIELFDARKEIKTPLMEIYLDKDIAKDPEKVRKMAAQIRETRVEEVVSDFSIDVARLQIALVLDKQKMRNLSITNNQLMKALEQDIKTASIKDEGDSIVLKTKVKENELMETYKLKEKTKTVFVRGVAGITQVLPVKAGNEFIILAAGSNLKEVFALKGVDAARTTTNDIFEVQKVLGIEAARQTIINEAKKVIEDQGLEVDVRHILFIADAMTATGVVKGITRSGITGEKESVLARASFETPIEHLVDASLVGEVDYLNSVIENVMLNQIVPLGTGLPDLRAVTQTEDKEKKEA